MISPKKSPMMEAYTQAVSNDSQSVISKKDADNITKASLQEIISSENPVDTFERIEKFATGISNIEKMGDDRARDSLQNLPEKARSVLAQMLNAKDNAAKHVSVEELSNSFKSFTSDILVEITGKKNLPETNVVTLPVHSTLSEHPATQACDLAKAIYADKPEIDIHWKGIQTSGKLDYVDADKRLYDSPFKQFFGELESLEKNMNGAFGDKMKEEEGSDAFSFMREKLEQFIYQTEWKDAIFSEVHVVSFLPGGGRKDEDVDFGYFETQLALQNADGEWTVLKLPLAERLVR